MQNDRKKINLYDISKTERKSARSDKVKTTDINILLNRVQLNKKKDFRKKVNFVLILISALGAMGIFSTLN